MIKYSFLVLTFLIVFMGVSNLNTVDASMHLFDMNESEVIIDLTLEAGNHESYDWISLIDQHPLELEMITYVILKDLVVFNQVGIYDIEIEVTYDDDSKVVHVLYVEIIDTTAPSFTMSDQTVEAMQVATYDWTTYVKDLSDNAIGEIDLTMTSDLVIYNRVGTYPVTIRATDQSSNYVDQTFYVTIKDTTAPTFDVDDMTIEAGPFQSYTWTNYMYNVLDNSDGPITKTVVSDPVNYRRVGTYVVSVRARDMHGNSSVKSFNVHIVDTTAPTFDKISNQTFEAGTYNGVSWLMRLHWISLITNVFDNSDSQLTKHVELDLVIYNKLGTYPVTVSLTDASGNVTTQTFFVTVVDTTAPIITLKPSIDTINVGATYVDLGYTVTDNDSNINHDFFGDVDTSKPGTYVITYQASDSHGNHRTAYRYVTVIEPSSIPLFQLEKAVTTLDLNQSFVETGCHVKLDDVEHPCEIMDENLNYKVPGVYYITYGYTHDGFTYTYRRYIAIGIQNNSDEQANAFYYVKKEEEFLI